MPHNNRMSTSVALKTSDIWSKTIGHDPYAAAGERNDSSNSAADAEKARGLLELARHQNIAGDTTSRDDFARKMYLGLKAGKKRRGDGLVANSGGVKIQEILEQDSSSSEDEYVSTMQETQKGSKSCDEEYSEESDSDNSKRSRRKRKEKKKHKKKQRKRHASSSSEETDDSDEERRRHKRKRRQEGRKRRRKEDEDVDVHRKVHDDVEDDGRKRRHGRSNRKSERK